MRFILRFAKKTKNKYGEICAVSKNFAFIFANIWEDKSTILRSARTTVIKLFMVKITLPLEFRIVHCKYLRFFCNPHNCAFCCANLVVIICSISDAASFTIFISDCFLGMSKKASLRKITRILLISHLFPLSFKML